MQLSYNTHTHMLSLVADSGKPLDNIKCYQVQAESEAYQALDVLMTKEDFSSWNAQYPDVFMLDEDDAAPKMIRALPEVDDWLTEVKVVPVIILTYNL